MNSLSKKWLEKKFLKEEKKIKVFIEASCTINTVYQSNMKRKGLLNSVGKQHFITHSFILHPAGMPAAE